jgi:hypothetical protein
MVFDAHDRAFAFFKGACQRGIYDNMKTAVETIFAGRERAYNRRFLQMCSHYLVDPVACTLASQSNGKLQHRSSKGDGFSRKHPSFDRGMVGLPCSPVEDDQACRG